jgi:hypothetical protein
MARWQEKFSRGDRRPVWRVGTVTRVPARHATRGLTGRLAVDDRLDVDPTLARSVRLVERAEGGGR